MSKPTAANLFILPLSSEAKSAELYQGLVRGISNYRQLGNRLIYLAEQAHAFRQFDKVREYGQILSNIPIKRYQAIGHYFLAVAANSKGNGDQDKAKRLFELAIATAPDAYKAKAILSLGALSCNQNDFHSALPYYQETIKAAKLGVASLIATRGIATVKSIEGDHRSAIADIERVLPVAKYAPAHVYFDLLNSYAVELGEAGRKDEARNIMRVVLASPFIHTYPEWQQTAADLQGGSRLIVQVTVPTATPENVLSLPSISERVVQSPLLRPGEPTGRLLDYTRFKKKMVKKKKNNPDENIDTMERKDLVVKMLELITPEDIDEQKLRMIVKHAAEVLEGKKP